MNFGEALSALKANSRISRAGWNGKGMWVARMSQKIEMTRPYLYMFTADEETVPWVASQTDILAEDWDLSNDMVEDQPTPG